MKVKTDTRREIVISDLLGRNPLVDKKRFNEARAAIRRLRRDGVEPTGYGIVSPFSKPVKIAEPDEDPRMVRVSYRRQ